MSVDFTQSYVVGEAERGKFVPIDVSTLTEYPTGGRGKYALLTYQVGAGNAAPGTSVSGAPLYVSYGDSASVDSFARLRVSNPETLFNSKIISDEHFSLTWDTSSSGGSHVFSEDNASLVLTLTADNGFVIDQTKQYFNYQPGKSFLGIMTSNLSGATENVEKNIGYFDDSNGIFLRQDGTSLYMVIRSSQTGTMVENAVPQSAWNTDPLDGTGNSSVTLDMTKSQIFFFDFEWLGVGRVRTGFFVDGIPIYAHHFNHFNELDSVYMSKPSLPIRYEIRATGTPGSNAAINHICSTLMSEAGSHPAQTIRSVDRANTLITGIDSGDDLQPLIGIRKKTNQTFATVFPKNISVLCTTAGNFRWAVILNPGLTAGGDEHVWNSLTNSSVEYSVPTIGAATIYSLSGGIQLDSGYVSNNNNAVLTLIDNNIRIGATVDNVSDELWVCAVPTNTNNESFLGSITFGELI